MLSSLISLVLRAETMYALGDRNPVQMRFFLYYNAYFVTLQSFRVITN